MPWNNIIIFRITAQQAAALIAAGVMRCQIVTTIPTSRPGMEVELICAFSSRRKCIFSI